MAARTLDQIISELNSASQPTVDLIKRRKAEIPGQLEADEQQLEARQTRAFDGILRGARRRGLGFSGIPLSEQADYTATEFLPALARARSASRDRELSLEQSLVDLYRNNDLRGRDIFQAEQDRAEQQRQFNLQLEESRRQARAVAAQSNYSNIIADLRRQIAGLSSNNAQNIAGASTSRGRQQFRSLGDGTAVNASGQTIRSPFPNARRGEAFSLGTLPDGTPVYTGTY